MKPIPGSVLRIVGILACIVACATNAQAGREITAAPKKGFPISTASAVRLVVTTSLLATVVHDLLGDAVEVETLMPAGTCPGQFDLDPGQARRIGTASLVLRHERQEFLDPRFMSAGVAPAAIAGPASPGIWTIPENYGRFCQVVGAEIGKRIPTLQAPMEAGWPVLSENLRTLSEEVLRSAAPLRGMKVLAAQFQAEFLSWLGLSVEGIFPPSDDPTPAVVRDGVRRARNAGVVMVVGNVQSGARLPAVIASEAGIPCAMLSNFPDHSRAGSLAPLLRANVQSLLRTAGRDSAAAP